MKNLSLLFFCLALFFVNYVAGQTLSYYHDGSNLRTIHGNLLGFSNRFGYIAGPESQPLSSLLDDSTQFDTCWNVTAYGDAGSELFDPLLNKYEGKNFVNSDHVSSVGGSLVVPKINSHFRGKYTYEDRWSQQFDRYAAQWEKTFGTSLHNSEFGLAEDIGAGATFQNAHISVAMTVLSYSRWGVVPGFDSAYSYQNGSVVKGVTRYSFNDNIVRCGIGRKSSTDLSQRGVDSLPREEYEFLADLTVPIFDYLVLKGGTSKGLETYEDFRLFAGAEYRGSWGKMAIEMAALPETKGFSGSLNSSADLGNGITLLGELTGSTKLKQSIDWSGFALSTPVTFSAKPISQMKEQFTITWAKGISRSVSFVVMADQNPLYESTGPNVIVHSPADRSILALGMNGDISFSRKRFGVTLGGMVRGDILDLPALSTPGFVKESIRIGEAKPDALMGTITLDQRAPVSQVRYDSTGSEQVHKTHWSNGISGDFAIPLVSPFLRQTIVPTLHLYAGPFRFARRQQTEQLPGANPIGPIVEIRLVGQIRAK